MRAGPAVNRAGWHLAPGSMAPGPAHQWTMQRVAVLKLSTVVNINAVAHGHTEKAGHCDRPPAAAILMPAQHDGTGRTLTLSVGGADAIASRPPKLRGSPLGPAVS